ncbi:MAG: WD40 repeat domain-containing protein [Capsulimonadaceae bacterium]|nr:WD40 repeat domain-containing protein [Capsulimonadaceae bacterium]
MKVFNSIASMSVAIAFVLFAGVARGTALTPQLVAQRGHSSGVTRIVYSPDGQIMASAGQDHLIRLWRSSTGFLLRTLTGHQQAVRALAFFPDGRSIVSGDDAGQVCIWATDTGRLISSATLDSGQINSLACSPDGRYVAIGGKDGIRLFVRSDWNAIKFYETPRPVKCIAFSPDSASIACGAKDRIVRLFDRATGEQLRQIEGHEGAVNAVSYSADGRELASASDDGDVRVWNAQTGESIARLSGHTGAVVDAQISADGSILSAGEDGTVRLWRPDIAQELRAVTISGQALDSVAWRPGSVFAAAAGDDGSIRVLDIRSGAVVREIRAGSDNLWVTAVSSNGRKIAMADGKRGILLFDSADSSKNRLLAAHGETVKCLAFSPDSRLLASGGDDNIVRVWDVDTASEKDVLRGHTGDICSVTFSPDGAMLASGGQDGIIRIWDVSAGSVLSTLSGGIRHDLLTGTVFPAIQVVRSLVFSRDASMLASACDDAAVVWNTVTGDQLAVWVQNATSVNSVAFGPDSLQLATGNSSGEVCIATVADHRIVGDWTGNTNPSVSVSFSADGKRVLSASTDGSLSVIGVTGSLIKAVSCGEPYASASYHYVSGRIIGATTTGVVTFFGGVDCTPLASLTPYDQGEWAAVSPDWLFDGSTEGLENLHWVIGNNAAGVGALYSAYHAPGLIGRILSGGEAGRMAAHTTGVLHAGPLVTLTRAPHDPRGMRATLCVEAVDRGGGIQTVRLYQNNVLINDDVVGEPAAALDGTKSKPVMRTYTVDLSPGKNSFKAASTSCEGVESPAGAVLAIDGK